MLLLEYSVTEIRSFINGERESLYNNIIYHEYDFSVYIYLDRAMLGVGRNPTTLNKTQFLSEFNIIIIVLM